MLVNQRVNIENRKRVVRFDEHNFVGEWKSVWSRISKPRADFDLTGLWQWTNIMSYVQATAYILAMITSCTILFGWVPATFDILALLIFIIESGVSIPQVIQNSQRKTTNGLKWGTFMYILEIRPSFFSDFEAKLWFHCGFFGMLLKFCTWSHTRHRGRSNSRRPSSSSSIALSTFKSFIMETIHGRIEKFQTFRPFIIILYHKVT